MGKTSISWCDYTWNPIRGCTPVSPGCENCYAKRVGQRFGLAADCWDGKVELVRSAMHKPLHWKDPGLVFLASMGDVFHDAIPDSYRMEIWRVMGMAPKHLFLVLTKRPERMLEWLKRWADVEDPVLDFKATRGPEEIRAYYKSQRALLFADMIEAWGKPPNGAAYPLYDWAEGIRYWPAALPNIWLGVTAENQEQADKRVPLLLQAPAAGRFVSVEPMLGPVGLDALPDGSWYDREGATRYNALMGEAWYGDTGEHGLSGGPKIDWLVCGGESGPKARPMELAWARGLRDECITGSTPFHFKAWGEWAPAVLHIGGRSYYPGRDPRERGLESFCPPMAREGKKYAGRLLDGREWNDRPKWP